MFLRLAVGDPLRTIDFFTRALDFEVMFRGPDAGGVRAAQLWPPLRSPGLGLTTVTIHAAGDRRP